MMPTGTTAAVSTTDPAQTTDRRPGSAGARDEIDRDSTPTLPTGSACRIGVRWTHPNAILRILEHLVPYGVATVVLRVPCTGGASGVSPSPRFEDATIEVQLLNPGRTVFTSTYFSCGLHWVWTTSNPVSPLLWRTRMSFPSLLAHFRKSLDRPLDWSVYDPPSRRILVHDLASSSSSLTPVVVDALPCFGYCQCRSVTCHDHGCPFSTSGSAAMSALEAPDESDDSRTRAIEYSLPFNANDLFPEGCQTRPVSADPSVRHPTTVEKMPARLPWSQCMAVHEPALLQSMLAHLTLMNPHFQTGSVRLPVIAPRPKDPVPGVPADRGSKQGRWWMFQSAPIGAEVRYVVPLGSEPQEESATDARTSRTAGTGDEKDGPSPTRVLHQRLLARKQSVRRTTPVASSARRAVHPVEANGSTRRSEAHTTVVERLLGSRPARSCTRAERLHQLTGSRPSASLPTTANPATASPTACSSARASASTKERPEDRWVAMAHARSRTAGLETAPTVQPLGWATHVSLGGRAPVPTLRSGPSASLPAAISLSRDRFYECVRPGSLDWTSPDVWARHDFSEDDYMSMLTAAPSQQLAQQLLAEGGHMTLTALRLVRGADLEHPMKANAILQLSRLYETRFPTWSQRPSVTHTVWHARDELCRRHQPNLPVHGVDAHAYRALVQALTSPGTSDTGLKGSSVSHMSAIPSVTSVPWSGVPHLHARFPLVVARAARLVQKDPRDALCLGVHQRAFQWRDILVVPRETNSSRTLVLVQRVVPLPESAVGSSDVQRCLDKYTSLVLFPRDSNQSSHNENANAYTVGVLTQEAFFFHALLPTPSVVTTPTSVTLPVAATASVTTEPVLTQPSDPVVSPSSEHPVPKASKRRRVR